MKIIQRLLITLITLLVIMSALPASAIDWKTFSPALCAPVLQTWTYPATGTMITSRHSYGVGGNIAGGPFGHSAILSVLCPIVRDDVSNINGLSNVTVEIFDNDSTQQTTCIVVTMSPDTVSSVSYGPLSTGIAMVGPVALNFGTTVTQTWNGGPVSILCTIRGIASMDGVVYAEVAGGDSL